VTLRDHLQEAFKLALSMTLFYWLALWMNWDMPKYGGLAIALISLGTAGASVQKGVLRMIGTTAGLGVGMLGLALFSQDRWLNMVFLASYLVLVTYFMTASRYGYAWFVAGFLPVLLWATTYGDVAHSFHYSVFRYLTTATGILIYSVVSLLLWPRSAGSTLDTQGAAVLSGLRDLFGMYRRQLVDGRLPAEAAERRSQLAGAAAQMLTTLQAAYADTSSVIANKRQWEIFRVNLRAFGEALVQWQECIDDCRHLDLDQRLPDLGIALDTLDRRFARIAELWQVRSDGGDGSVTGPGATDDAMLLAPQEAGLVRKDAAALSHFDRAGLLSFVQQLHLLDKASREMLRTMRGLAGLDDEPARDATPIPTDPYRPSRWDPLRLVSALFPAICFVTAYVFWIYTDPPSGPNVPSMAATLALVIMLSPMNAFSLLPIMLGVIWVAVAPIYFFVMPRLDTGFGILALIFSYTFASGLLGMRSPGLKTMMLLMFTMLTGISNDQVYSFMGLISGAFMFALSILIIGVVQTLLTAGRPEKELLQGVRRFFGGCARIVGTFGSTRPRQDALRKRLYQSMVLPVPRRLQTVAGKLDYALFPNNGREKVGRLLDAMHSITLRLDALGIAHSHAAGLPGSEPFTRVEERLRDRVQGLFERWSRLEPAEAIDEGASLRDLVRDLEADLEASAARPDAMPLDDATLVRLYAMLGCARGLVHVVADSQDAVNEIDWDQWAEARF
jgi:uncharacterized membrane protein YccC